MANRGFVFLGIVSASVMATIAWVHHNQQKERQVQCRCALLPTRPDIARQSPLCPRADDAKGCVGRHRKAREVARRPARE
eukprot:1774725-Prymnesium_polylepis.1